MSNDDEYNFISYVGEAVIAGKKFSCRGQEDTKLQVQVKYFISLWSALQEWHEFQPTEEEQSEDIIWKMVHEGNQDDTAFIRVIYKKRERSTRK
jgi:hypothetical protein